jgi:CubicO group peptidase (beta-lactamase class C family)
VSTMGDYARFLQFCLNEGELEGRRLMGRATLRLATRNHLPAGRDCAQLATPACEYMAPKGFGFGFGFAVALGQDASVPLAVHNSGAYWWSGAAGTFMFCDPKEQLFAMLWTQVLQIDPLRLPLREPFTNMVYAALLERDAADRDHPESHERARARI